MKTFVRKLMLGRTTPGRAEGDICCDRRIAKSTSAKYELQPDSYNPLAAIIASAISAIGVCDFIDFSRMRT